MNLGVFLIIIAVAIMLALPVVLNVWTIAAWWLALAVMTIGVINVCRTWIEAS